MSDSEASGGKRGERRTIRRRLRCLVRIGPSAEPLLASTRDVGSGGIYIETSWRPPLKSAVDLELFLDVGQPAIRVSGRVVRFGSRTEEPGFAIRFDPGGGARAIADWVVHDVEAELRAHQRDKEQDEPAAPPSGPGEGGSVTVSDDGRDSTPSEVIPPAAAPSSIDAAVRKLSGRRAALGAAAALSVAAIVGYLVSGPPPPEAEVATAPVTTGTVGGLAETPPAQALAAPANAPPTTPALTTAPPAESSTASPSEAALSTSRAIEAIDWEPPLLGKPASARRSSRRDAAPEPPRIVEPAPGAPIEPVEVLSGETPTVAAYNLGVRYLAERKALLALEAFQQGLQTDPNHALTYRGIGVANVMLGHAGEAAAAFERFVALAPDHPSAARVRQVLADYYARR